MVTWAGVRAGRRPRATSGSGVGVQAGEVHVGDGLAAEDGVDPEGGQPVGVRGGGVAFGIVGGVAQEQDIAGGGGPVLGRMGQEGAQGFRLGQAVVEVVVDALEGHGQGGEALLAAQIQQGGGGGQQIWRADEQIVGSGPGRDVLEQWPRQDGLDGLRCGQSRRIDGQVVVLPPGRPGDLGLIFPQKPGGGFVMSKSEHPRPDR